MQTTFGVVIPTYRRKDGKTPFYLRRCLDSVFNQVYKNFHVYLIGDKYEPAEEFFTIASEYPPMYSINLSVAAERDKYVLGQLWTCGGTNATNIGIDQVHEDFVCCIDHDDYWKPEHLATLRDIIELTNVDFACTQSVHINHTVIPILPGAEPYVDCIPCPGSLVKSSACWRLRTIPLKFRNVLEETGVALAGDFDLWARMHEYMLSNGLKGMSVRKVTCVHDTEGYSYGAG